MFQWLQNIKEGDKVSLLLLYTGLLVLVSGVLASCVMVFFVHTDNTLDRILTIIALLTTQGGGLVTAAMGFLRLQPKPPSGGDTQGKT